MQDSQGLIGRVGDIAGDLLRMAQTRIEMLGVELQIERDSLLDRLRLGMFAAVASMLAGVAAMLWIAVVAPPALRGILLGVLTLLWIAVAMTAVLLARSGDRRANQPLFGSLVAQLRRDRSTLSPATAGTTTEVIDEPTDYARPAA